MKKIRVAILADFPLSFLDGELSGRGGGQGCTWLPQLALSFQNHTDLEVHWLILNRGLRKQTSRREFAQWFHQIPAARFSVDLALNYLPARWALGRAIRDIQPDVVHAWGAELIYPAALKDFHGPRLLSIQGTLTEYQKMGGLPNDWRWRKMASSEIDFVRSATIVTGESAWVTERIRELKPDADCRIVEYGVHPRFYETAWQPDANDPYALYVGGGGYRKGTDILMQSLALLPERNWNMRFAGDEALAREVAQAGLSNCTYLGMLRWQNLISQMSNAWCVVVPTRSDSGPTVVKEARVIGLPVIGTVHGGLRDYVKHGINGMTVDPLNAANLASAIRHVMGSLETAKSLGSGLHVEDRANFLPELTASRFAEIYRELSA